MLSDERNDRLPLGFHSADSRFLVRFHKSAVACDIGTENGWSLSSDAF